MTPSSPPLPPADRTAPRDLLASLPRQDRHKPKCGPVRPSRMGKRRALVLVGVHVLIGLHFLHWWWTGESVTPVEPSEAMQTLELGRINAGFLFFLGAILVTLLTGRWFCGWACHVVALQDLCAWLLGRVGLRPRPVRSRLLVLGPWVVGLYMFVWPQVELWWKSWWGPVARPELVWELYSTDLWQTFPKWVMAPVTILVVGFLIVWWLGAKGFCTHGCPYGAFFAIADRFAPVRIKVTDACDACGHCTSVCSSNVRVHEEVAKHRMLVDPGCMKCLDCVSVCPKEALYVGFAAPKPLATSQQRIQARADFTWPEEVLLAVVALVATQWTFRSAWFGEGVPLLLAVGLGVVTAVFTLLFVRLLRRPDVTFQHTVLKSGRSFTRAGRIALVLLGGWLLFTTQTFVAQRLKSAAMAEAREPLRVRLNERKDVDPALFQGAHAAADRALAWHLAGDPELLQVRGLLRRELNRHDEAERDLRAALHALPHLELAGVALAIYRLRAQDFDEAERLVRQVLAVHRDNPTALAILEQLEARRR